MPQTLSCIILYSEDFHPDDQKAAKKAGIETIAIANFHYTDKIKAIDIQYKAADNDKGLQILTFNWKRPKGMAHANVPDGPKQVAKGYKAALKKMKPSVRRASFLAHLCEMSTTSGSRQWPLRGRYEEPCSHRPPSQFSCPRSGSD